MRFLALALLLAGCSHNATSQSELTRSNTRLCGVELDTEQLKQSLSQVQKEHEAATVKLEAYISTLDTLQKGCADAKAIETLARAAQEKALASAQRAEEVAQLRAQMTDILRLVEQTQKKINVLESHIQSYWGKMDALLALKSELAALKSRATTSQNQPRTTYTVEPGDSLDFIARKFGISPTALSDLNNLSDGDLKTGQKLHIPSIIE